MQGPRRSRAVQDEDKFMQMADYEFADRETFQRYQGTDDKRALFKDFMKRFGGCAELRSSVELQNHP
jgi:hypothetical protein